MDFVSPRFQGHQRLQQILNQSPGGTLHLEEGHTGADVKAVQKALWDLAWTFRIQPPVDNVDQFVIGTFGPITSKTVKAFRTHYGIIFAGAPAATGTVGTATMVKLDALVTWLDASAAAIRLHAAKLASRGVTIDLAAELSDDPHPAVIKQDIGVAWRAKVDGVDGAVMHKTTTGAYYVVDPILEAYLNHGFAGGPLGFPVWDPYDDGGLLRSDFEGGSLRENASGGVDLLPLDDADRALAH